MLSSSRVKGFFYILTADLLWGLSGTAAKYFFNRQVSPYDLVQMRLLISSLLLALALALVSPGLLRIERRDVPYMMVFSIAGMSLVQFTYFFTISQTNVATAIFLEYLCPVFILLYQLFTRKENFTRAKILSLLCAVGGGFLMVKGKTGGGMMVTALGLASGLTSAVAFAFYTLYSRYGLKKYSSWTVLLWGMVFGALVWCCYRPPWITFMSYGPREWWFFLYIAIFATIIPFGLFFLGLRHLTPVVAGITSTMEPVAAGVMAFLILGEVLTGIQLAGCLLILIAVALIQKFADSGEAIPNNQLPPA
jgi:drug/metabolite transporter (DMT)-like permease